LSFTYALGPNDEASCCVHPDPHFLSFHGIPYDYQHGCDVVLVNNANIKIHLRLVKYLGTAGTAFSFIDTIGIQVGSDIFEATTGGNYYVNQVQYTVTGPVPITNLGGLLFSISLVPGSTAGYQYLIEFPTPSGYAPGYFNIAIDDYTLSLGGGDRQYGVSLCINAHGSYFQGSEGMCGEWDASTGLSDRSGTNMIISPGLPSVAPGWPLYDGSLFGIEWQVGTGVSDGPFVTVLTAVSGHGLYPASCIARRRRNLLISEEEEEEIVVGDKASLSRFLQESGCSYCEQFDNPIQRANCEYDAQALGCDTVKSFPFYSETTNYYKPDMKPLLCEASATRWKRTKCEKYGGECVIYCDTKNPDYNCTLGLCRHKKSKFARSKFGDKKPVLLFDRYYNGCACMIKKGNDGEM